MFYKPLEVQARNGAFETKLRIHPRLLEFTGQHLDPSVTVGYDMGKVLCKLVTREPYFGPEFGFLVCDSEGGADPDDNIVILEVLTEDEAIRFFFSRKELVEALMSTQVHLEHLVSSYSYDS